KPQAAVAIDTTAPRAGVGRWSLIDSRTLGLRIDLDDITGRKIEQIGIVLLIRMNPIGSDALARLRILEVAKILHLVGDQIEPVDVADVRVFDPHLVIDIR